MLESQKRSIRRQATEIVSEPFYVQLGLVERKHQPRRSGDLSFSPEQGSGFFQLDKEEIIETYEHDQFLEQVIKQDKAKAKGSASHYWGTGCRKNYSAGSDRLFSQNPRFASLDISRKLGREKLRRIPLPEVAKRRAENFRCHATAESARRTV
jgi:hypothetical protein